MASRISPHPNRLWLYQVVFESDSTAGRLFDLVLIGLIIFSVIIVSLESVPSFGAIYAHEFHIAEWIITALFTIEYILRLACVARIRSYALSFYGVVDFLAVLPSYLSLFFAGSQFLMVVRVLRLMRIFQILKLSRYVGEGQVLLSALRASRAKIVVFLFTVLTSVILVGAVMYIVEGPAHGFDSIPRSVYWAIVTITTVGFGDIAPKTPLGQFLSTILMIMGYGIIAVPTGIVTVELGGVVSRQRQRSCEACSKPGHDSDAIHCKYCGVVLR